MSKKDNKLVYLPLEELYSHPDNPRKELGDVSELAESIKAKGIMQNLTVVPREEGGYTVIIGHRRTAAAKAAGLSSAPCIIADMTPAEQVQTMLLENMQRSDLTVYEQAQGFQMMIDLGDTVEGISQKTGFSKKTVNRRLKMAELDQDVLKSVSSRQLSLDDFDKLYQIDDLNERNKVLQEIGTPNFNQSVASKIKKQNIAKKLPLVREVIKTLKARKIERSETYGFRYESVCNSVRFDEWDPSVPLLPKTDKKYDKLFYYIDESFGTVGFYRERPKEPPKKRPRSEIEREKYIAETRTKLSELTADMYHLRQSFINTVVLTQKNTEAMLRGAVTTAALNVVTYVQGVSKPIYDSLGIDTSTCCDGRDEKAIKLIQTGDKKCYPKVIYSAFGDRVENGYYAGYAYSFPVYSPNYKLNALYTWLIALGYEMSDEEKTLQNGTHPLFVDKDVPSETTPSSAELEDGEQLSLEEGAVDKPSDEGNVTELLGQLKDKFEVE